MLLGLPEFEWLCCDSVAQACALLAEDREHTALLAGGTDLFPRMKHRRRVPRRLLNIKRIPGLDLIEQDEGGAVSLGALITIEAIATSPLLARAQPALVQAARVLGTLQIRNTGTIGGNLANASPSAEFAPPLLALGASVRCTGHGTQRSIPLENLFIGPGKTALRGDEMITHVEVPALPAGAGSAYFKHSLREMDIAIASAAVRVVVEAGACREARIALGAVGPVPFRAHRAEALLRGARLDGGARQRELLEEAARAAAGESLPIDDVRAHAGYRRKIVTMLVGKGLERLLAHAPDSRRAVA
ncbi:MAG: xanthine dehydrogenase family protein subunit M [Burkholderiales bacterium]|nr:xanthine dehydrogenase family protein subunit M [Burkholderiales bacterium]